MKIKKKKTLPLYSQAFVLGPMKINYPLLKRRLKAIDGPVTIFFVDAGTKHKEKIQAFNLPHLTLSLSFGDGDSSQKLGIDIYKTNQNLSDLSFICQWFLKQKKLKSLIFLGFSRGRLDHQLANLGEINQMVTQRAQLELPNIEMVLDNEITFYPPGVHSLFIEEKFSIMSLENNVLKLTGDCDFKLKVPTLTFALSSRTLSNVGRGQIKIEAQKSFMIIRSKESARA